MLHLRGKDFQFPQKLTRTALIIHKRYIQFMARKNLSI